MVGILLGNTSLALICWNRFQKKKRVLIHKCRTAQTSEGSRYLNFGFLVAPFLRLLSPAENEVVCEHGKFGNEIVIIYSEKNGSMLLRLANLNLLCLL